MSTSHANAIYKKLNRPPRKPIHSILILSENLELVEMHRLVPTALYVQTPESEKRKSISGRWSLISNRWKHETLFSSE